MSASTEVRAERLRVLLALHQGADTLGPEGCKEAFCAGLGPTDPEDLALLNESDTEDKALALACFAIEADLRRRGWDALERLGAQLAVAHSDSLSGLLDRLDPDQARAVACAVRDLGWLGNPPSENH